MNYGGHLGRKKTYRKIKERFYRPKMKQEVEEYVKTCDTCQKNKIIAIPQKAPIIPITPSRVNEMVATDFAGPFKETSRRNKYLMIMTDLFGKWLEIAAVPNKETVTAANVLIEQWCCRFGVPERVLSDKGKEFRSQVWDSMCELLDIERLTTTPGHPECDGQAEKAVQQVKKMIRTHVDENQDNWDVGLAKMAFAYNSSVHETTGQTPFETMFGRRPRIPIDIAFPNVLEFDTVIGQNEKIEIEFAPSSQQINMEKVEILEDSNTLEKLPRHVREHIENLKCSLQRGYEIVKKNRVTKMKRGK